MKLIILILKKFYNVSLRVKVIGLVIFAVLLLGLPIIYFVNKDFSRQNNIQLRLMSRVIGKQLSSQSVNYILDDDIYALTKLLRGSLKSDPDEVYAFIQNKKGDVVASTFDGGFPAGLLKVKDFNPKSLFTVRIKTNEGMVYDTSVPILKGKLGTVRVGISSERSSMFLYSLIRSILLIMIFAAVLAIIFSSSIAWWVMTPIVKLSEAFKKVKSGSYDVKLDIRRDDEIGMLTRDFNKMIDNLKKADDERAENDNLRKNFITNLNHSSANAGGEPNFSNASYLVVVDESNKGFARFLKSGKAFYAIDKATGKPVLTTAAAKDDLWPNGFLSLSPVNVNGVNCMTSMQMLWGEIKKHTIEEYAKEAGLAPRVIPELAEEFTSHGKTAVADYYRGPVKHTNGFYHGRAIQLLNVMVGNVNWQGGYINGGGSANIMGGKGFPYNLGKWPGFVTAKGVKISREGSFYEKSMEYKEKVARGESPFPAQRFGEDAFLEGGALNEMEDYYLKMAANIAYDSKSYLAKKGSGFVHLGPVPDANADEMQTVKKYVAKHGKALRPYEWKKVAYVFARGGRYEDYDVGYLPWGKPKWVTHLWNPKAPVNIYNEDVATTHNAITGERFNGTTILLPHRNMRGEYLDRLYPKSEYPFRASTHRQPIHSKSRTIADPWLVELLPDAFWEINEVDAKKLGLSDGDVIKVISPTYEKGITHRVRIMPGIRPGVITAATAFGRWLYGSGEWYIDGKKYKGDPARNGGVHPNALFLLDKSIAAKDGWTTVLTDPVGGSMVYYYAPVKIEKV